MKEVFTKSFWEGVKKTFEEAQQDSPPAKKMTETPPEGNPATRSAEPPPVKCELPEVPEQKLPAELPE